MAVDCGSRKLEGAFGIDHAMLILCASMHALLILLASDIFGLGAGYPCHGVGPSVQYAKRFLWGFYITK